LSICYLLTLYSLKSLHLIVKYLNGDFIYIRIKFIVISSCFLQTNFALLLKFRIIKINIHYFFLARNFLKLFKNLLFYLKDAFKISDLADSNNLIFSSLFFLFPTSPKSKLYLAQYLNSLFLLFFQQNFNLLFSNFFFLLNFIIILNSK
jgi:hypothetical protein